ncbi:MAG: tetratricopeptide repeat protein [Rhodospirillales bacterium]|nr:tetratricopeptide repeat protein [Rhodospirillales bacterium]
MNRKERRRLEKSARKGNMDAATVPEALQQLIALYEKGRLREALKLCRNLLSIAPGDEDLLHLAGAIAAQLNDPAAAAELLQSAIEAKPDHAEAHYNLGNCLRAMDRAEEAVSSFRAAIELEPGLAEAHNNLGITLAESGCLEEAVAAYAKAVELRPGHAAAHNNLAIALHELGRTEDAEAACRQAIALMPAMAEAHNGLANILKFQGRTEEAIGAYGRAIELNPQYAEAHNNLGILLHEQRNLDAAIAASRRAIELMPSLTDAYKNLGYSLQQQGRHRDAAQVYDRALSASADPGIAVRRALLLPLIPQSRDEIRTVRETLDDNLSALLDGDLRVADPNREIGITNFFLAYHGLDDRPFQKKLADFHVKACPDLTWTAPHLSDPQKTGVGRPKIGFVSRYLIDSHTIGKLFGGLIGQIPRDRFETILFRPTAVTNRIDAMAERVVHLSDSLEPARRQIADCRPDILIYLDIGMEPLSYFLAFSRLAPVQCVTFGHPVTTGIGNLDFFLTTPDLDPDGFEEHYTERLERLPRLPVYYSRPDMDPADLPDRAALGLPEDRHLYVCTQTLFKMHPDFDDVLAAILARDPKATAVFIEGTQRHMAKALMKRMEGVIPDADSRIVFLPALEFKNFLGLSKAADVLLDTVHYSGGNTSLEALALGAPVVTWPSGYMRGRWTYAVYKDMGIDDLIAQNLDDYVDLAVRTATDRDWRESVCEKIRGQGAAFFENRASVDGFVAFLDRVLSR